MGFGTELIFPPQSKYIFLSDEYRTFLEKRRFTFKGLFLKNLVCEEKIQEVMPEVQCSCFVYVRNGNGTTLYLF